MGSLGLHFCIFLKYFTDGRLVTDFFLQYSLRDTKYFLCSMATREDLNTMSWN